MYSLLKNKVFDIFYVDGCQGPDLPQTNQPDARSTRPKPVWQVMHQFTFLAFAASITTYYLVTEAAVISLTRSRTPHLSHRKRVLKQ